MDLRFNVILVAGVVLVCFLAWRRQGMSTEKSAGYALFPAACLLLAVWLTSWSDESVMRQWFLAGVMGVVAAVALFRIVRSRMG